MKKSCVKYQNYILTAAVMFLNVIVMAVCFDFYYDLNDDMMMKDIMSGVYTGTPDGRNMQTLYILGFAVSLCYRLCRTIPWYGLFLCLCQFGCFYLLGVRLTELADPGYELVGGAGANAATDGSGKAAADGANAAVGAGRLLRKMILLLVLVAFQWGVCLPHLINIQYTITCAIMSATAIFLFYTTPETDNARAFVVKNIPAMLLVILAYQLRTEMLLLSLPFVALAGVFRWVEELRSDKAPDRMEQPGSEPEMTAPQTGRGCSRGNRLGTITGKYLVVAGIILVGMLISSGIDYAAYGNSQWKDFRDFFDARTTVYDFYPELVTQDEYSGDLTQLGVTEAQQTLLRNYNFGLDESIDTALMERLAAYAGETIAPAKDWAAIFKEKAQLYVYRSFHNTDAPYNIIVLWAYAAVLLAGFQTKQPKVLQVIVLLLMRTAIWMFVLMRGRDPERITHSLYLIEFALLAAIFVRSLYDREVLSYMLHGMKVCYVLFIAIALASSVQTVQTDQIFREKVNQNRKDIEAYCRVNEENFYFEDVYSTVSFSQKIFEDVDNTYANYDILGGWMCKSPLWQEKLFSSGIEDTPSAKNDIGVISAVKNLSGAAAALLYQENVYLIMSDIEAADQGFDWLTDYYAEQDIAVQIEQTDTINENYAVYKIRTL